MPDFLTRRSQSWHFVRRVPAAYSRFDRRGVIRHSTGIRIADDRTGRRAAEIARQMNAALEAGWKTLAAQQPKEIPEDAPLSATATPYEVARRRARSLGYEYLPAEQLIVEPLERLVERIEVLIKGGGRTDVAARAALLGTEAPTAFPLSKLFEQYEAATKHEVRDLSPDQLRVWRNARVRSVNQLIAVIGDKPITALTEHDGIDYVEWWRGRVLKQEITVKSANKDIGQLSRMLKELSIRKRLGIPDLFKGLHLRGEIEKSRQPYDAAFIEQNFLRGNALDGLNEEARLVIFVMIETGLRLSEIVNLRETTILLDVPIPYVRVEADGRRLKTEDSAREIPLVGSALAALRRSPKGFPRYRDKASSLSGAVNKYLDENGLRPTPDHSIYSLRHSFKDRLIAAEAPDSLIDNLMGHKTHKPKYGRGPALELKRYLPRTEVVLVEAYETSANPRLETSRDFKGRVLLVNRDSVLIIDLPLSFAEANGFVFLAADRIAVNPAIHFAVESFVAKEGFTPARAYASRLKWRDLDGNEQSKLLLSEPEQILEALTGKAAAEPETARKRTARPSPPVATAS